GGPWPLGLRREPGSEWELGLKDPGTPQIFRTGERISIGSGGMLDWSRLPVDRVTTVEAKAYAAWLASSGRVPRARLCTPLEWERAARGADARIFPHGNRLEPGDAGFQFDGQNFDERIRREVGSFARSQSPFGVDDLAGN